MSPQLLDAEMADAEQAALAEVDERFGSGAPCDWSPQHKQAAYRAQRACIRELYHGGEHPVRRRRVSAHTVRQRRNRLRYTLHLLVPGAVTILVTPSFWGDSLTRGRFEPRYTVAARDADGRMIRRPRGSGERILVLLRDAFPESRWDRCQTWHASSNSLVEYTPVTPAGLGVS